MAKETEALEPCPFCGGEAEWIKDPPEQIGEPFGLVVQHAADCYFASLINIDDEEMIAAWNHRTTGQGGDVGEALEEAVKAARASTFATDAGGDAPAVGEIWTFDDLLSETPLSSREIDAAVHSAVKASLSTLRAGQASTADALHPVLVEIMDEVEKATRKFPTWPTRIIDAGNVVSEEAGELAKACLQVTYEPDKETLAGARMEAIQTAAMAFRFVCSMDRYDVTPGEQHEQAPLAQNGGIDGNK